MLPKAVKRRDFLKMTEEVIRKVGDEMKMIKVLAVFPERCTGCHICELYCSFRKSKVFNLARSRIHVIRNEPYIDAPVVCLQCGLCIDACPAGLITRDRKTGAIVINEKKCTGCALCISACPYGVLTMDPIANIALKCDLCDGDPECVKHCPEKALLYIDVEKASYYRRLAFLKISR